MLGDVGRGARAAGRVEHEIAGPPPVDWADHDDWDTERRRALTAAGFRPAVSATYLAGEADTDPGLDKGAVDLDLPPWQRGRYGTAVGRAVHAVLQYADLDTGAGIDAEAAAQCAAEGVVGVDATVAALARSALAAPIVVPEPARPATGDEELAQAILALAETDNELLLESYALWRSAVRRIGVRRGVGRSSDLHYLEIEALEDWLASSGPVPSGWGGGDVNTYRL